MKTLFVTLFVLFSFAGTQAQIVEHQKPSQEQLYRHKIEVYNRTKNAGSVLILAGLVTTTIGAGTLYSCIHEDHPFGYDYAGDLKYNIGIYGMGFGIDMIIGGVILKSIGTRKVIQYKKKLDGLSAGLLISPDNRGFGLVYRF